MKRLFITGLVILLPVTLTILIVIFIFNLLTDPFVGIVSGILNYYGLMENGFWFLNGSQLQRYISQILILGILFGFTVLLGVVARWVFFHYFLRFGERILHQIPLISSIYKTSQDIIKTIFASKSKSFKQVVMIPFPSSKTYSIGFLTCEKLPKVKEGEQVAVFVPTTPNPTSGFLLMVSREDVIYLNMKIEEALKYVISCGVTVPSYRTLSEEEALALLQKGSSSELKTH